MFFLTPSIAARAYRPTSAFTCPGQTRHALTVMPEKRWYEALMPPVHDIDPRP